MLKENQLIEVKFNSKIKKHYSDLGYDFVKGSSIFVPPEHLTPASYYEVIRICDCCGEESKIHYNDYIRQHHDEGDFCKKCRNKIFKINNLKKYGVESPLSLKQVREKIKNTNIEKYGVDNVFKSEEIKNKIKSSMMEKYDADNPMKIQEIRDKVYKTNMEKYGSKRALDNLQIAEKAAKTRQLNQSQKTSTQQNKLFNLLKTEYEKCEMNYPLGKLSLDCMLDINDCKIDIEYDGWYWHQDKRKDYSRDVIVKKYGFKVLRIRSGSKIPDIEELKNKIQILINTDKTFQEIILDDWKN